MSAFSTNHRDHGEYPILNLEAENEHLAIGDSIIAWLETCKSPGGGGQGDDRNDEQVINHKCDKPTPPSGQQQGQPQNHNRHRELGNLEELCKTLPPPSANHPLSAPGMAWSLIKKVAHSHGVTQMDLLMSAIPHASEMFQDHNDLHSHHYHYRDHLEDSAVENGDDQYIRCKSPDGGMIISAFGSTGGGEPMVESSLKNGAALRLPTASASPGDSQTVNSPVRMRGNNEWAPPRAQIIFNIHEETNFRKLMQRQNYRCAGCGTKIDLELARRLVLYCHYLGKYFCKCCFSHKAIHLPGYILQKWDFHKYSISHFALQLLDRIANEPLFNINDINSSLYRKVKKLRHLLDIRMQLYYLKIYISTCTQTDKLDQEYASFTHQHLLQDDVHLYSLNNLIEIQHGKLYEYLNDLVSRSVAHIAKCDRCRAKGHYCQLCGPSSLISSMILSGATNHESSSTPTTAASKSLKHSSSAGQNIYLIGSSWGRKSPVEPQPQGTNSKSHSRSSSGNFPNFVNNFSSTYTPASGSSSGAQMTPQPIASGQATDDHELIFPFEIGRVAQCQACGCCFHLQCFMDAGQNCPKCERIQRRNAEIQDNSTDTSVLQETSSFTSESLKRETITATTSTVATTPP